MLFPEGTGLWVLGSILSFLAAGESMLGPCLLPAEKTSLFGMEEQKEKNKEKKPLVKVLHKSMYVHYTVNIGAFVWVF